MGIKNLMLLIKKFAPNSLKERTVEDFKGQIIGVDSNMMLYKAVYAIRKNGYDIKSESNNKLITTHIHGFLLKLKAFKKYDITPVFVFDGVQPKIKQHTLDQRKQIQQKSKQLYDKAVVEQNKEGVKKYFYMSSDLTQDEINDVKTLIKLFGYTVVQAPEESDSQLGYMSYTGLINSVISDDMDILLFGAKSLLKNFSVNKHRKFVEINLDDVKRQLGVTQKQLIDIGIISGCDYCGKAKGVGPVTAYKMIKNKADIKIDKVTQRYFRKPKVLDMKNIKILDNKIDRAGLTEFLKRFGYTDDQINKI